MTWGTLAAAAALTASLAAPANALPAPVWMCHDSCGPTTATYPASHDQVPLDTTDVTGGPAGTAAPQVDCFYVYPTVDNLPNLVPVPTDEEFAQSIAQVGMLAPRCRIFAPTYRQRTLPELALSLITKIPPDYSTGIGDVEQAFQYYWDHDNTDPTTGRRRGVVLLGHSQGAAVLAALIRHNFDNNADMRKYLVSAILLGGHIVVPTGRPDGGGSDPAATFQHVPACRHATDTGCVVAYSSYKPGGQVPSSDADLVRVVDDPRHQVLCVNPAALLEGTDEAPLDTILYTRKLVGGNDFNPYGRISSLGQSLTVPNYPTGFARYHGTLTGRCKQTLDGRSTVSWLDVTGGDNLVGLPQPNFYGLHAVDFNLTAGDLKELIGRQAAAWSAGT
ncbi:DUF3089 domain-containing protein [Kutzneria kofuensis]|uniref:DUF3089 domain-containing protein n=1 Tax=Kutzneria kofuensis TaxID=103725 RepID=A0A7W9KN03_9PSEU|nr:DUF3089 domain-containing protein [Kutzneria kofuensis]MBB5895560.1 hypothetical protein [Kutzneria kofuensis]